MIDLNTFRHTAFPPSQQFWGMVIAWPVLLFVAAGLSSAKTWAATVPVVLLVALATWLARGQSLRTLSYVDRFSGLLAVLLAYAGLSLLWTPNAASALPKYAAMVALFALGILASRMALRDTAANSIRIAEGLWIGMIIGLVYMLIEMATGSSRSLVSTLDVARIIRYNAGEETRVFTSITLLLPSALLAIAVGLHARLRWRAGLLLAALAVIVVVLSPHDTSRLALVASGITWAAARLSATWTRRALQVFWITACLLIVPLALAAHHQGLAAASWLPRNAQARIHIWKQHADRVVAAPFAGYGYDAARIVSPVIESVKIPTGPGQPPRTMRTVHPHNAYLQVWFELGAIGAVLFCLLGLSLISSVESLRPDQRPPIYATLAAVAVMLSASYGLSQTWYLALLVFTAYACAVVLRLSDDVFLEGSSVCAAAQGQPPQTN